MRKETYQMLKICMNIAKTAISLTGFYIAMAALSGSITVSSKSGQSSGNSGPSQSVTSHSKGISSVNSSIRNTSFGIWVPLIEPSGFTKQIPNINISDFHGSKIVNSQSMKGVPNDSSAHYLLASVHVVSPRDHINFILGDLSNIEVDNFNKLITNHGNKSYVFDGALSKVIQISCSGDEDNFSAYYGAWHGGLMIPLKKDGTFDIYLSGVNPGSWGKISVNINAWI